MLKFNVLGSAGRAAMAIFNTSTVAAQRAEQIIDNIGSSAVHATASLDDLAENMHDSTRMSKLDDFTRRRKDYLDKYQDSDVKMSPALLDLVNKQATV